MKRRNNLSYILIMAVLAALFLSMAGCGGTEKSARTSDIAVLYTGDVHCAADENISYAGLAAFKKALPVLFPTIQKRTRISARTSMA